MRSPLVLRAALSVLFVAAVTLAAPAARAEPMLSKPDQVIASSTDVVIAVYLPRGRGDDCDFRHGPLAHCRCTSNLS